jgi:hypothetical protein
VTNNKTNRATVVKSLYDSAIIDFEQMDQKICKALEDCDLLYFKHSTVSDITESAIANDPSFSDRYNCLSKLDLFTGFERKSILPLASNLLVRTYRKGQYIQLEGKVPEGLVIIRQGFGLLCSHKVSAQRSTRNVK